MMPPFPIPHSLSLNEYEAPFDSVDQLAEFIFEVENDSYGYVVLRTHILEFTYLHSLIDVDWEAICCELKRYPELPHQSLGAHRLEAVFAAGKKLLTNDQHGV